MPPCRFVPNPIRWIIRIVKDNLRSKEVRTLLSEHLKGMADHSPPESIHALDLAGLTAPAVTFWTVWQEEQLMGCGALQQLDQHSGEIKSMRTASAHLGKGVASAMLRHLITTARKRGYRSLYLETGSTLAFEPALALYRKFGFGYCGPFAHYVDDSFSRFMCLKL